MHGARWMTSAAFGGELPPDAIHVALGTGHSSEVVWSRGSPVPSRPELRFDDSPTPAADQLYKFLCHHVNISDCCTHQASSNTSTPAIVAALALALVVVGVISAQYLHYHTMNTTEKYVAYGITYIKVQVLLHMYYYYSAHVRHQPWCGHGMAAMNKKCAC